MNRRTLPALVVLLGLAACSVVGPSIAVQPGPGRSGQVFAADRRECMASTDRQVQPIANQIGATSAANVPGAVSAQVQVIYDRTYGACMASRGNVVAASGQAVAARSTGQASQTGLRDPGSMAARQSLAPVIANFVRACEGERIQISITEAVLSPSSDARTIELSTPTGGLCFGEPGRNSYIVAKSGSGWRTLLAAEPGSIRAGTIRHKGYVDPELHSLGLCVYDYRWDGAKYARASARNCATSAPPTISTLPRAIRRN